MASLLLPHQPHRQPLAERVLWTGAQQVGPARWYCLIVLQQLSTGSCNKDSRERHDITAKVLKPQNADTAKVLMHHSAVAPNAAMTKNCSRLRSCARACAPCSAQQRAGQCWSRPVIRGACSNNAAVRMPGGPSSVHWIVPFGVEKPSSGWVCPPTVPNVTAVHTLQSQARQQ